MNDTKTVTEAPEQIKVPDLREGLSVIPFPELGEKNRFHKRALPTTQKALDTINNWLAQLNEQNIDIISIIGIPVQEEEKGIEKIIGSSPEEIKQIAIVRKIPR